jgi:hypothetical protein
MKVLKETPKYTAEQISEIVDRITTLRQKWLSSVAIQIGSSQKSKTVTVPDEPDKSTS